ncbi:mechanosensitive ion channel protein MscS [Kineobactrum sediminis]|uniref:Mechanosensitive ion channel protein MscS n=1 Tax=Kineobactrum sediminis TaxID=1905677 RepID=A0A2N5Y365_9GAMM|nr:mechanosensitive ion channel family protein [Kineobactrum sediminis]PLW82840.1 mechanosensitive ion channel protein MscS [Kineobactrum sediminis]
MELLNREILDNSLQTWLVASVVFFVAALVLRIVSGFIQRRLSAFSKRTRTNIDDYLVAALGKTKILFLLIISIVLASSLLTLPVDIEVALEHTLIVALLIQIGFWVAEFSRESLDHYRKRSLSENPASVTTINVLGLFIRITLWSVVFLLALDNLGVDITALIAGLGIGGIAVALASQKILGDLFASLSIMLDRPFAVGDFLILDDYLGSVEQVGLKTTRLRSLSGEQLVFSNSDLLDSRIRNYGRMYERRVVFKIGVTYYTPRSKLKAIPAIMRNAVEAQEHTRFDRSHFASYGDYSLVFETVFYVLMPDYNVYMDIQQGVYFYIHEQFEREQIEFAFPTQQLFVTQTELPDELK